MTYIEVKKIYSDKFNKLLEKNQVFWAFSREQLEEGFKKTQTTGKDCISIGLGGFIPKKNVKQFKVDREKLEAWRVKEFKKVDVDEAIEYELANFECYYTGNITDAYEVLKDLGCTREQVKKVLGRTRHMHE